MHLEVVNPLIRLIYIRHSFGAITGQNVEPTKMHFLKYGDPKYQSTSKQKYLLRVVPSGRGASIRGKQYTTPYFRVACCGFHRLVLLSETAPARP